MDGSFTTGCAVSAMVAVAGYPVLGMVLGFVAGAIAGMVTGLLITKLNINEILAGILTQTAFILSESTYYASDTKYLII